MNMNQILNMLQRMLLRRAMNWGINKGIGMLGKRTAQNGAQTDQPEAPMTPEERKRVQQSRDMAKRARQAARITRRL
ncbi:MAG: hypothetical protein Q4G24_06465 [Paracoccus sp. (in: a-proteobacteria)]|uniref:hypothetical protein n=1 Tax=Paracoccus sp. TaxID=267 RepID=UPI0026DF7949|nr:hypothetical protein [Paracoccus sp. (in: a-proteobacteria)]MDO5621095.1 hypothetical protein [Paracoccus sp. (in: a-proteobacteria)]